MFSNKLYTPLRYPGGKARFAPFIAEIVRMNGLGGGHYLEPYAGGAGVALELLIDGHVDQVHINDADPAINDFWMAATRHSAQLQQMLGERPVTIEQWKRCRAVVRGEVKADQLERGFATLFLNRTNRSGILNAGVIGGIDQAGTYRLDARFDKGVMIGRLQRIATVADRISVYCEDAGRLLARCMTLLPAKSLIYLDPPYFVKGKGLYRNFYQESDHLAIARRVQAERFGRKWVVSYDDAPQIREMYTRSPCLSYDLNYTAQKRYWGEEVMFFHRSLKVPDMDASKRPVRAA